LPNQVADRRMEEDPESSGLDSVPPEADPSDGILPWARLTSREVRVAELVLEGLTNPEIGRRLEISRRTVSSHLSTIFRKLGLHSRIELILRARDMREQTESGGQEQAESGEQDQAASGEQDQAASGEQDQAASGEQDQAESDQPETGS
jgi:DNA-binding CsgD family transcriptional regulator